MEKKKFGYAIVAVYVVLSLVYICNSMWDDFVAEYRDSAYNQGREETINQIIGNVQASNCEPVTVFNEAQQVQLLDVNCLQPAPTEEK